MPRAAAGAVGHLGSPLPCHRRALCRLFVFSPFLVLFPFSIPSFCFMWSSVPLSPEGCLASGASAIVLPACFLSPVFHCIDSDSVRFPERCFYFF